jgi:hypothetical protein
MHIVLGETLETLREDSGMETLTELTKEIHFYPDLHGKPGPPFPICVNFLRTHGYRTKFECSAQNAPLPGSRVDRPPKCTQV